MANNIHPTAIIAPGVTLGDHITIEPYVVINSPHVVIHDHVTIKSHVYIDGNVTIGEHTIIYPGASIGTKPQALKFNGEKTFVTIGKHSEIREFVTINSSLHEGSTVEVGDYCLLMAYCHVAHDCKVGNHVIMSNAATLAGHVTIEDYAVIGGFTPIHQFSRVGAYAMVGGACRISRDVPPYTIGGGVPYKFGGINMVGLKRNNIPLETRTQLSKAFKVVYRSELDLPNALQKIESEIPQIPEVKHFVEFLRESKRGIMGIDVTPDD